MNCIFKKKLKICQVQHFLHITFLFAKVSKKHGSWMSLEKFVMKEVCTQK